MDDGDGETGPEILTRLHEILRTRKGADPEQSYTARLYAQGRGKIAQKLGEEAVETVIEAVADNPELIVTESADLLYHLLVLWADADIPPERIWAELASREGKRGIRDDSKSAPE